MQADGSRKFIGDNKLMIEAIRERTNVEIQSLLSRKSAQDNFKSADYQDNNGEPIDWGNLEGSNVDIAEKLKDAEGPIQAAL
jgi:hypothetical protein